MKVGVDTRYITPRNLKFGTYGSYGLVTLSFIFTEEWEGLVKTVAFYPLERGYNDPIAPVVILDDTNEMKVPQEVTLHKGTGEIVVEGIRDGEKIVTVSGIFEVLTTIKAEDPTPTPSEMEQALLYLLEAKNAAQGAERHAAEAGKSAASASESAAESETQASASAQSASEAEAQATASAQSASEAEASARAASQDAESAAGSAARSANMAQASASQAESAAASAENARTSANSATAAALNAAVSANRAENVATEVKRAADSGEFDGKDGYTPVKGVDYFTQEEVDEIVDEAAGIVRGEIPTKVSELENDAGYLTSYTETDPTVPAWAKQPSKPSYAKSEVGLSNVDNVRQYSAENPPPYPVTSVNGKTGAVVIPVQDGEEQSENAGLISKADFNRIGALETEVDTLQDHTVWEISLNGDPLTAEPGSSGGLSINIPAYDKDDIDGIVAELREEINYKPISISAFVISPSEREKGSTISLLTLLWTLNKNPKTTVLSYSGTTLTLDNSLRAYTLNEDFSSSTTFTLSVTDEKNASASKTATLSFKDSVYYGTGAAFPGVAGRTSALAQSRARTFTVNAGSGNYVWYAYPASWGDATFTVGGFEGGFTLYSTENLTNSSGRTIQYKIYKSDNAGLGNVTVVVS